MKDRGNNQSQGPLRDENRNLKPTSATFAPELQESEKYNCFGGRFYGGFQSDPQSVSYENEKKKLKEVGGWWESTQ